MSPLPGAAKMDVDSKSSRDPDRIRPVRDGSKILVAFFSWSGNTRGIANHIHDQVGGEIFEIISTDTYPEDYEECVEQAKQELDRKYMPRLKSEVSDPASYDTVFVGYPNWWGTIPMPVAAFISKFDSPGRTVIPFCTHGGGGRGRSIVDITRLCPRSRVLDALTVSEGNVEHAREQVSDWLHRIGMIG